jgi:hypothetical protein
MYERKKILVTSAEGDDGRKQILQHIDRKSMIA